MPRQQLRPDEREWSKRWSRDLAREVVRGADKRLIRNVGVNGDLITKRDDTLCTRLQRATHELSPEIWARLKHLEMEAKTSPYF